MQLASRFANRSPVLRSSHPLSDDEIRTVAPSIFADTPHDSRAYATFAAGRDQLHYRLSRGAEHGEVDRDGQGAHRGEDLLTEKRPTLRVHGKDIPAESSLAKRAQDLMPALCRIGTGAYDRDRARVEERRQRVPLSALSATHRCTAASASLGRRRHPPASRRWRRSPRARCAPAPRPRPATSCSHAR